MNISDFVFSSIYKGALKGGGERAFCPLSRGNGA